VHDLWVEGAASGGAGGPRRHRSARSLHASGPLVAGGTGYPARTPE